ncbi:hypothetical protein ACFJIY_20345 [Pimelobacter simplex]|uniref:hypothetical protein n=1 Tax=Nocardioides simplex TaxID=2045 RepID=UPI00366C430B
MRSRQLSELRRHKSAVLGVAVFAAVAVVLTSMVAGTLSRSTSGDTISVTAVFRDATGLRAGTTSGWPASGSAGSPAPGSARATSAGSPSSR